VLRSNTKECYEPVTEEAFGTTVPLYYCTLISLRHILLFPLFPPRYAVADDTFPDGTRVKRGARNFYAIYSMGRMESVWGSNAAEFRPERW